MYILFHVHTGQHCRLNDILAEENPQVIHPSHSPKRLWGKRPVGTFRQASSTDPIYPVPSNPHPHPYPIVPESISGMTSAVLGGSVSLCISLVFGGKSYSQAVSQYIAKSARSVSAWKSIRALLSQEHPAFTRPSSHNTPLEHLRQLNNTPASISIASTLSVCPQAMRPKRHLYLRC
ncbi:hypothetical protein CLU79DRAFT_885094 [Phycomyces nitens]|nr:hypothetical protein CLU79DRAFT_885094 [Phycomyces nitens]